jgi:hypothetical protein
MIFNPFSGIPANKKSHVRGWAMIWAELLATEIAAKGEVGDDLYLDHGVNFGGSMNLFGGVTTDMIDTLSQLLLSPGHLTSLDMPMPNYVEQLSKRLGQATCHPALSDLLPALSERFGESSYLTMAQLGLKHVTIGDSHASAFSPKGSSVLRTNGATLYGALRDDSIKAQIDSLVKPPERVTLVYGSIDVRHHLCRQTSPEAALDSLIDEYSRQIQDIQVDYMCEVEVAAPVPVEFEGRKIPKTGFYKDTPFAGTRDQRLALTRRFIRLLQAKGLNTVTPPIDWYDMDGEDYANTCMELSSSVHISPTHYRRYSNWS